MIAELEADYTDDRTGTHERSRRRLPLNRPIKLGRLSTHADWPIPDPRISGYHADATWDGEAVTVSERPPPHAPPGNPILFKKKPTKSFRVRNGEKFTIGTTKFKLTVTKRESLHDDEEDLLLRTVKDTPAVPPAEPGKKSAAAVAVDRGPVRPNKPDLFDEPTVNDESVRLRAVERLINSVQLNYEDFKKQILTECLSVLESAIPEADLVRFVTLSGGGGGAPTRVEFVTASGVDDPGRGGALYREDVAIEAIDRLSAPTTRIGTTESDYDPDATVDPRESDGTDGLGSKRGDSWAVCAPVFPETRAGFYVAGTLRGDVSVSRSLDRFGRLRDIQRVVQLVAQVVRSAVETNRMRQINRQYERYFSPSLRKYFANDDSKVVANCECVATVLFCDLRGSVAHAEAGAADLAAVRRRIGEALERMTSVIHDLDGVVGDFQGDAAMGYWGWPQSSPDQVRRAAEAAVKIRREFAKYAEDRGHPLHGFQCGIGLAHGPVVAGMIGPPELAKVGVFGPVVNRAARLQSATKSIGVTILADHDVCVELGKADNRTEKVRPRRLAKIRLRGIRDPFDVFELLPAESDAYVGSWTEQRRKWWESLVHDFVTGTWPRVANGLVTFPVDRHPEFKLLHDVMARYDHKVPADWDGVVEVHS